MIDPTTTTGAALVVTHKTVLAPGICQFELADPDGNALSPYRAGAHVAVQTPNGAWRTYSLNDAGSPHPDRYVIAVAHGVEGGGAASLIDGTAVGDVLRVSAPRNAFALAQTGDHLLIAGGIGITAIRSMMRELRRDRPDERVRLLYLTRSPVDTAYFTEFSAMEPTGTVRLHHSHADGRLDLWPYLAKPGETHVYCCGPRALMDDVRALTMHWDPRHVHFEDFGGVIGRADDSAFTVIWQPTNTEVPVASDQTIVEALRTHGILTTSSCNAGACGTCTLRVLSGVVEHRDVVLSEQDRKTKVSACVSRAVTPALTLAPIT